ncbi:hypothetical protein PCIT_a0144 [Pseudoalteromonas citrea]|uniref:STAS domain-containing protein n=2 Tax=Pseudoalteromonas citrea TaxID=43655 RepID=A0AAD4AKH3_9GAMM|nr:STAS domain-containing protein [Pseudoalteromonas citrea]KAF7773819.1 hypothetical protein PCIT_a0144 [Pseudoalteromonas citrea]
MSDNAGFQFPNELTIYEVANTYSELKQYLTANEEVSFNFSYVNEIDSSGLQLTLWALDQCSKNNKTINTITQSDLVRTKFSLLGICLESLSDIRSTPCQ